MRKLVIASHGDFAKAAFESAMMITGAPDFDVEMYCMEPDEVPEDFAADLEAEVRASPETEFVILADLYGASICNSLYPLCSLKNVRLFSGYNLRLVVELLSDYREPLSKSDVEKLVADNREGLSFLRFDEKARAEDF